MKILLTGASGLIGRALIPELMKNGHQVLALARRPDSLPDLPRHHIQKWSDHEVPDLEFLKNCEAIIHLAGEGIADQLWSEQRKKRLRDSRILGTRHLTQALAKLPPTQRPQVFLSGSAIGIYAQSQNEQNESSPSGHDFLADLTRDWEAEARNCEALGIRTVYLRTGLVLSHLGGLLAKMGPVALGSGQHWMSWIHIKDVVGLIAWALQNPHVQGAVNLTSPQPVQNLEFTKTFCKVKHLPFLGKVPALLIKGIAG